MVEVIQVNQLAELQELREQYMKELLYVQDLNAEENVWECYYYKIRIDSTGVGYFCADVEKTLWEFYLTKEARINSQEVFKFLLEENYFMSAECKSYDHLLMSLCFDLHKKATCSAYLFRKVIDVECPPVAYKNIVMRKASIDDYECLSEINCIAEGVNFFHDLQSDIKNGEVFVFYTENEMIGSGTMKKVWHNMDFYDIGMLVPEKHRQKGLGTFILLQLKEYCYNNKLIPVCGCWYYNYSSKKTLEKAGFIGEHRMIRFEF